MPEQVPIVAEVVPTEPIKRPTFCGFIWRTQGQDGMKWTTALREGPLPDFWTNPEPTYFVVPSEDALAAAAELERARMQEVMSLRTALVRIGQNHPVTNGEGATWWRDLLEYKEQIARAALAWKEQQP